MANWWENDPINNTNSSEENKWWSKDSIDKAEETTKNTATNIFEDLKDFAEREAGLVPGINYRTSEDNSVNLPGTFNNPIFNTGASLATRLPDLFTRFQMGRADNPTETEKYLDKRFGPKNWAKAGSRYVIRPEVAKKLGYKVTSDEPLAIDPFGPDLGDASEFAGKSAGPLAGGVAAGMLTGGAGFVPGILAAGIGGAAGEAGNEALKYLQGFYSKTPEQLATDIGAEGLSNAAGEGVFRIATPILSKILGPHTTRAWDWVQSLFGKRGELKSTIDPDVLEKLDDALRLGYRPSVSTATDKNILGRIQSAADFIFGNPREAINERAMIDARNELSYRVNPYPTTGAPAWSEKELISSAPQEFVENAGKDVVKDALTGLQDRAKGLLNADALAKTTDSNLQKALYEGFAKSNPKTGEAVKNALNSNIKAFYNQAKEAYSLYDNMVKTASIDLNNVKSIGSNWLSSAPVRTTEEGVKIPIQQGSEESLTFLKNIANMDDMQTANAALSLRTALSSSMDHGPMPGVPDHIRRQMIKSIDQAMDDAAEVGSINPEAVSYLKNVRSWYKENLDTFNAKEVQRLLVDPSAAGNIPADRVVDFISNLKSGDQVLRIKAALPNDIWKSVQRGTWDNLMKDTASASGNIDGKALARVVENKRDWLVGLYGKDKADQIVTYSKFLSAKNGDIPLENLPKGDPYTILRNAATEKQALDDVWNNNKDVIDLFTKGGKDPVQFIPSMLSKSEGGPIKINKLKALLGEDSDAWRKFQAGAMEKILQPLVNQSDNAVKAALDPTKLRSSISNYDVSTLKAVFGDDMFNQLVGFSDLAKYATSKKSMFSGNIVAATIAMHPLAHLGTLAKFNAVSKLMSTPFFLRYITTGLKEGWTRDSLRALTRITAQIATPDVSAEDLQ